MIDKTKFTKFAKKCSGTIEIRTDGSFEMKPHNKITCKKVLDKLNPVKGNYWKRHIEDFKREVKFSDIEM